MKVCLANLPRPSPRLALSVPTEKIFLFKKYNEVLLNENLEFPASWLSLTVQQVTKETNKKEGDDMFGDFPTFTVEIATTSNIKLRNKKLQTITR